MNRLTSTSASCAPASLTSARTPWALLMATATAAAVLWPAAASAGVTHVFKRDVVHSSANMCAATSSGESLADSVPPAPPACAPESAPGDFEVTVRWADGTTRSAVWAPVSGKNLAGAGPVLFPGIATPGVHFDFTQPDPTGNFLFNYRAFVEQSGDTFSAPWELRNGSSSIGIASVEFAARGTPDMGFDTDDGTNAGHGAGGFPLQLDVLNQFAGDVEVVYDWYNDWNGTTDMFHRMTLNFLSQGGLLPTTSMIFLQDTDEVIPEPGSLALVALALGGLGAARRRRA